MYTFNAVFTEEDLVLFASLNWKIHFYFSPGKDGWRALISEQRQIIGEAIKTNKIVNGIEYTSSTYFHLFSLDIKMGQLVKMKFN